MGEPYGGARPQRGTTERLPLAIVKAIEKAKWMVIERN